MQMPICTRDYILNYYADVWWI